MSSVTAAGVQEKLKVLQEVVPHDRQADLLLEKLLAEIARQYRVRLERYERDLRGFEQHHGLPSAEFYEQFEAGQLGDDVDFFEWAGLYELWRILQQKVQRLEATL